MKSLNLINGEIKATKKYIYKLKDAQEGTNEHFKSYALSCKLKDLETIKQDLEVLEILRKYLHKDSWDDLTLEIRDLEGCKSPHKCYKEEFEDYNRVKQWLEENE